MQQNWIGRSEGARVRFDLTGEAPGRIESVEVFTTRPDTLHGASFLAVAANHPLALALAENDPAAAAFNAECARLGTSEAAVETAEKRGHNTGLEVRHPLVKDATLPVYIANFVLMEYGTGAIFGCPAHDQRDLDFANTYGLPVIPVVLPDDEDAQSFTVTDTAYTGQAGCSIPAHGTASTSKLASGPRSRHSKPPPPVPARSLSGCVTGACHGSATGAVRFRSFTVTAAAWYRFQSPICRSNFPRTSTSRHPATRCQTTRLGNMSLPALRWRCNP